MLLSRIARYAISAATGHKQSLVAPINTWIPLRNGSVFDCFKFMQIALGFRGSSTDKSFNVRWQLASKFEAEGTVISPDRKKPKKQTALAAQSITLR